MVLITVSVISLALFMLLGTFNEDFFNQWQFHFLIIKCKFHNLTTFNLYPNDVRQLGGWCNAHSRGHAVLNLSLGNLAKPGLGQLSKMHINPCLLLESDRRNRLWQSSWQEYGIFEDALKSQNLISQAGKTFPFFFFSEWFLKDHRKMQEFNCPINHTLLLLYPLEAG